jgi:hypothetical protein
MIIDHTGVALQPLISAQMYILLRCIGRLAFPIYVFFIAEGCGKTRDIHKYVLRLFIFALISEAPFDLALFMPNFFDFQFQLNMIVNKHQNVFFTLFFGAASIMVYQLFDVQNIMRYVRYIFIIGIIALGELLYTDYGSVGIAAIFLLYITPYGNKATDDSEQLPRVKQNMSVKGKLLRIFFLFLLVIYLYVIKFINWNNLDRLGEAPFVPNILPELGFMLTICGLLPLLLLTLYNGRKGPGMRWLFYASYPAHLLILIGINYFLTAR